jgi:hypothetical protein
MKPDTLSPVRLPNSSILPHALVQQPSRLSSLKSVNPLNQPSTSPQPVLVHSSAVLNINNQPSNRPRSFLNPSSIIPCPFLQHFRSFINQTTHFIILRSGPILSHATSPQIIPPLLNQSSFLDQCSISPQSVLNQSSILPIIVQLNRSFNSPQLA